MTAFNEIALKSQALTQNTGLGYARIEAQALSELGGSIRGIGTNVANQINVSREMEIRSAEARSRIMQREAQRQETMAKVQMLNVINQARGLQYQTDFIQDERDLNREKRETERSQQGYYDARTEEAQRTYILGPDGTYLERRFSPEKQMFDYGPARDPQAAAQYVQNNGRRTSQGRMPDDLQQVQRALNDLRNDSVLSVNPAAMAEADRAENMLMAALRGEPVDLAEILQIIQGARAKGLGGKGKDGESFALDDETISRTVSVDGNRYKGVTSSSSELHWLQSEIAQGPLGDPLRGAQVLGLLEDWPTIMNVAHNWWKDRQPDYSFADMLRGIEATLVEKPDSPEMFMLWIADQADAMHNTGSKWREMALEMMRQSQNQQGR